MILDSLMNVDSLVIIVSFLSLLIGLFIGIQSFKFYTKRQNKKILKNAEEVLSGKRDNKIKIDGKELDATKFRLKNEDDKEVIIDLQEGGKIQDGKKNHKEIKSKKIHNSSPSRKNSRITRNLKRVITEKKRTSRNGARTRRYG